MSIRIRTRLLARGVCLGAFFTCGLNSTWAQQSRIDVIETLLPQPQLAPIPPLSVPIAPISKSTLQVAEPVPQPKQPAQHLTPGPLNLNQLPADVLNCNVCRQRLGLPPLPATTQPHPSAIQRPLVQQQTKPTTTGASQEATPKPIPVSPFPMLGTPGIISSTTAEQLATHGLVVEEFKPPQPEADAFQLQGLPLAARQQFMQELNLPQGARIMSAAIVDPNAKADASEGIVAPEAPTDVVEPALPVPPVPQPTPVAPSQAPAEPLPIPSAPPTPDNTSKTPVQSSQAVETLQLQIHQLNKLNHDTSESLHQKNEESQKLKAELSALQASIEALKREAAELRKESQGPANKPNTKEKPKKRPSDKKNNLL